MVMYCSGIMHKYYSHLGFFPLKHNEERKYIHNEIFNNIPHFIKNRLHFDFIQDDFSMYNDKLLIRKIQVIPTTPDTMMPMDFC